jgi:23S rRNA (adenine-N6)-dimethyltransferase
VRAAGRARQQWGWHPLDSSWAARLVAEAGVGPGDLVLDIGAGTGAITAPLLAAGARVIAVELHPVRAAELRRRFAHSDVVVVQTDATDLRLPRRPFSVVANPPWSASASIIRRLLGSGSRLQRADLVLPEWAAERWCRKAPLRYDLHVARSLPRAAFRQGAPVSAAVLVARATPRGARR